jgi:ABC-type branched-subunit amino acid transport system substrate-binding protein
VRWLRFAVDELVANGRLDRNVEFVHGWGLGLPTGTAAAVEHAYAELIAGGALLIIGPAIGDNALVAAPLAQRHRTSTINWAGSERARNEYMFHLQVGSHEDEPAVLVRYLASCGITRVGLVSDRSPIGRQYKSFFEIEADVAGLSVTANVSIPPLADEADTKISSIIEAGVEAIAYVGLGVAVPAVARSIAARQWRGLRVMNSAGIRGHAPDFAKTIDEWVYVDMHSDANTILGALRARLGFAAAQNLSAAKGYDLGRLVAEGLARAPELSREGVKEGLELVKWLPAAEGHEGTLLGFGKQDRGALHGRYLVLRQWREGKSIEVNQP